MWKHLTLQDRESIEIHLWRWSKQNEIAFSILWYEDHSLHMTSLAFCLSDELIICSNIFLSIHHSFNTQTLDHNIPTILSLKVSLEINSLPIFHPHHIITNFSSSSKVKPCWFCIIFILNNKTS